uniref:CUB and zona pellucida-like domains 1, tandem duplicate 1 n=1 Tax=Seriola dumerili TaxID=41447 RepID=A0A3B4UV73_SERDU
MLFFCSCDSIENHPECNFDVIYVYDGSSTGSRLLGKVCGSNNAIFRSTGSYLTFAAMTLVPSCPPLATPCGGSLSGSGTFSSPNHPNYYYDNAYCVWQLRAPYDQRIFLDFTFLLENCCNCDYVSVYDGPSVGSRYLGKVCNNSLNTFYSTSNYMTVLFRTDGSVVGRGFKAEFAILSTYVLNVSLDCSSDNMNIVIERSYLNSLGYDGHSLYLDDPYCRPQVSRYQVVFNFPINTCGTARKFENGKVVYTNAIRAYTSNSGEITRQTHLKLNVGCRMEQDSVSQIMYLVEHHDNSSIVGTGRFNTSMAFYTSSSFYYQVCSVPYKVTLNQNMYVQVDLRRGDSTLVLFLDTCVTSPSPHDFQSRPYYLVRNGCPVDNTYYAYTSGTNAYARFRFRAFQFLRATESVYIQCKVLICQASDYNSRCRRGCNRRMTRDVGSKHDSQTLVMGPIQLKASTFHWQEFVTSAAMVRQVATITAAEGAQLTLVRLLACV